MGWSGSTETRLQGAFRRLWNKRARCGRILLHMPISRGDMQKPKQKKNGDWFGRMAQSTSHLTGHPVAFIAAALSLMIWGVLGPLYRYSDTWQLVANTATS